jgi:hypothetical protein
MTERKRVFRHVVFLAEVAALGTCSLLAHADPPSKVQCVEANTKGQDLRREGELSGARSQFHACAVSECPVLVRDDCTRRLDEVDRAQPTVVFEIKDGAGNDLPAVKVSVDGQPLADSLDGSALLVDPGTHNFTFEVAGQPPVAKQLVLHEGEKGRIERVTIAPSALAGASREPAGGIGGSSNPSHAEANASSGQRTVGLVVGGVGVASLVAGAILGGLAIAARDNYEKDCGSNIGAPAGQCNQQGIDGHGDASTKGTLSTVFFVAGGVLAAAGAVVFFTAPSGSTQVGVGPTGAYVSGRF